MVYSEELCPGGYRFFYDGSSFRPGTDTFLLSSLPRLKPGLRVCDLCGGTGLLGLLLLQRQAGIDVTGVELSPEAAALAARAAEENGLTECFRTVMGDVRDIRSLLPAGGFDLVVCNPPYYPVGSGAVSPDEGRRNARLEASCTLEDVCAAASYLLRWGGAFCIVHKPERLTDVLYSLREAGMEPKRLRLVEPRGGTAPSLALIEGRRGGRPGLTVESPLVLTGADGQPADEVETIYFRWQPRSGPSAGQARSI